MHFRSLQNTLLFLSITPLTLTLAQLDDAVAPFPNRPQGQLNDACADQPPDPENHQAFSTPSLPPAPPPFPPAPRSHTSSSTTGLHQIDQQKTQSSVSKSTAHTVVTKTTVSYSGPGITGTASLPPTLSAALFPTNSIQLPFPDPGAGQLGQNSLPQASSNGNSQLGTLDAPQLLPFVGASTSEVNGSDSPWGNRTAGGTNPYDSAPNTGVTRSYSFNIARGTMAPDGVEREVLVVNGQFPGPTIEANWGDTIQVTITNNITGPEEGTSFHWHGLRQVNTEWADGVPGISQCPIAPGTTFTYTFQADLYGTSWWHSHFSAQYAGGVIGAMIIHGPANADYGVDLGPVLLTDYYHEDYLTITERVMGTNLAKVAPYSQNNLINGKGNYNCSLVADNVTCTENAGLSKFQFASGKTHRIRLINGGSEGIQRFSIDGHILQVIAYDFVPIVPYNTTQVTLGVGQRADILVEANGSSTSSYWMRSSISSLCSLSEQPDALAIIYYEKANTTAEPTSTSWTLDDSSCSNDALSLSVPSFPLAPPTANTTVQISLSFEVNSTGHFLWTLDGSSFRTDYNEPILPLLQASNATSEISSFPSNWNVYNFGNNESFIVVVKNENPIAHPMHIHGHNMFVLSEGTGTWDGSIQGNATNPARRDVQLLQPDGYLAIQVNADNPGVWPFHCHIAWHVSGGLYMNILERPNDIASLVKSPSAVTDLCETWSKWTSKDTVEQIDSGLRKVRRTINSENKMRSWSKHGHRGRVRHT